MVEGSVRGAFSLSLLLLLLSFVASVCWGSSLGYLYVLKRKVQEESPHKTRSNSNKLIFWPSSFAWSSLGGQSRDFLPWFIFILCLNAPKLCRGKFNHQANVKLLLWSCIYTIVSRKSACLLLAQFPRVKVYSNNHPPVLCEGIWEYVLVGVHWKWWKTKCGCSFASHLLVCEQFVSPRTGELVLS